MRRLSAALMLLATTFFWGITFTVVKEAVARVDMFVFLAQRFTLAALLMIIPGIIFRAGPSWATLRSGIILGLALFSAYAFQTAALLFTTASNTGFLTGLNVVFVPLLGAAILRHQVPYGVRWGAPLAAIGLFLLCTGGSLQINRGDLLGLICAVCVAGHILLTGHYTSRNDVYWMTAAQMATIAVASSVIAIFTGKQPAVYYPFLFWPLLLCAIFASVFAFLVQTAMQRHISPAQTALIFCLEPVFAAGYAYAAAGEKLTPIAWLGALLILAAMLLSEFLSSRDISNHAPLEAIECDS